MFDYETFTVTRSDAIAHVALNRPEKGNCLNGTMWQELRAVFEALDAASDVRAVILGGSGSHFSTGIDLEYLYALKQEMDGLGQGRKQEFLHRVIVDLQDSVNAVERCRKPVIAAIHGYCLGGGVDIACACDLRLATAAARFSVKEVDLAIVADLGTLQRLPAIVGQGIARELAFTGRRFNGEEARSFGFVNQVHPDRQALEAAAVALAEDLAAKSPLTLRGIKETMNFSRDHSIADGLRHVAVRNAAMLVSKDLEEAVVAFMQNRPPRFED
jgi:enoyl-CoA hydratase